MSARQPAPGPWTLVHDDFGWAVVIPYPYGEGEAIWTCSAPNEKTAHLIAAAPELLEALIYLVNAHEHPSAIGPNKRGVLDHVPPALDRARAAIAKVTP